MKQGQDKLTDCKCCNSNACYKSEFTTQEGKVDTWLCMTCGFTSNTTMKEDDETLIKAEELTAELISLKKIEKNSQIQEIQVLFIKTKWI